MSIFPLPWIENIYQTHATPIGPKASEADGTKVATHSENTCSSATWSFGYTHGHDSTPSYVCLYDVDKHTRTLLPFPTFSLSLSLYSSLYPWLRTRLTDSISLMASCSFCHELIRCIMRANGPIDSVPDYFDRGDAWAGRWYFSSMNYF